MLLSFLFFFHFKNFRVSLKISIWHFHEDFFLNFNHQRIARYSKCIIQYIVYLCVALSGVLTSVSILEFDVTSKCYNVLSKKPIDICSTS